MKLIQGILMIVLTIALFRLYHKMFRVIYTNALSGIARELFICFLLARAIVVGIPLAIQSVFLPKKPVPDYYGNFYNTAFWKDNLSKLQLRLEKVNHPLIILRFLDTHMLCQSIISKIL